jgi:hypothetical protein
MSGNADRFHIPTGDEINDLLLAKDAENIKKINEPICEVFERLYNRDGA